MVINSNIIPEQFTVKAHPALFEGSGHWEVEYILSDSGLNI